MLKDIQSKSYFSGKNKLGAQLFDQGKSSLIMANLTFTVDKHNPFFNRKLK